MTLAILDTLLPSLPPLRYSAPVAFELHQTGETDLDKILHYYTTNGKRIAPHYFIETIGTTRRLVPENHIANHSALYDAELQLYRRGYHEWSHWLWNDGQPKRLDLEQPNYAAWRDQWLHRGLQSPLDLVTGLHPNSRTIGIEFQKPKYPRAQFLEPEQYEAGARLIDDVATRQHIAVDREHVLQHYDVSPLRRSTDHGSYDLPSSFSFNALWDLLRPPSAR
jgi:hypothetical protein